MWVKSHINKIKFVICFIVVVLSLGSLVGLKTILLHTLYLYIILGFVLDFHFSLTLGFIKIFNFHIKKLILLSFNFHINVFTNLSTNTDEFDQGKVKPSFNKVIRAFSMKLDTLSTKLEEVDKRCKDDLSSNNVSVNKELLDNDSWSKSLALKNLFSSSIAPENEHKLQSYNRGSSR